MGKREYWRLFWNRLFCHNSVEGTWCCYYFGCICAQSSAGLENTFQQIWGRNSPGGFNIRKSWLGKHNFVPVPNGLCLFNLWGVSDYFHLQRNFGVSDRQLHAQSV